MADAFKLVSTSGDQSIDVKPATTLVVGRAVNSDVPIYDPTISRQHAQLSVQNGGILVKDLGSSNGTFVQIHGDHALLDVQRFGTARCRRLDEQTTLREIGCRVGRRMREPDRPFVVCRRGIAVQQRAAQ